VCEGEVVAVGVGRESTVGDDVVLCCLGEEGVEGAVAEAGVDFETVWQGLFDGV
jgi:hypothetical protein